MDERSKYIRACALLYRTLAAMITAAVNAALSWNAARAWRASPRELLVGFVGAATQRAGLPLPIVIAALLPFSVALRGVKQS